MRMQWNVAQWFSSPNNVLMFLWIDSDTAGSERMTDGLTELLCFVSQSWASPEPVQPVCLVCWSICLSVHLPLSVVTTATAVWKDDAEVIIRKITHMSRSENRQSVSGIGGKVCVRGIWDSESTSVCGQQGDLVDREGGSQFYHCLCWCHII